MMKENEKVGGVMNVAVIGMGYVGTTMSVALSLQGHQVMGLDVDKAKIAKLRLGTLPIYEEGMEEPLQTCIRENKLSFHDDLQKGIHQSDLLMITVGTPAKEDGSADLSFIESVATEIGKTITNQKVIVIKSTVPVGTGDRVTSIIEEQLSIRGLTIPFAIVSNPEFLREGNALYDALHPERIVVGCESQIARNKIEQLYQTMADKLFFTSIRDSEMIKYASNAFLAMKISFVNELARLSEKTGTNITQIAKGIGLDSRIGPKFLQAGIGYGGSCFPKDTEALLSLALESGVKLSILQAVTQVNQTQVEWFLDKIIATLGGIKHKRIAVLGLTFKPNTDDIRESPVLRILAGLLQQQAVVTAYDPKGMSFVKRYYQQVEYQQTAIDAVNGADAIILATEWPEIVQLNWEQARKLVANPYLFDGRNVLHSDEMKRLGFYYVGVGVT